MNENRKQKIYYFEPRIKHFRAKPCFKIYVDGATCKKIFPNDLYKGKDI